MGSDGGLGVLGASMAERPDNVLRAESPISAGAKKCWEDGENLLAASGRSSHARTLAPPGGPPEKPARDLPGPPALAAVLLPLDTSGHST